MEACVVEHVVDGPRRDIEAQLVANVVARAKTLVPPLLHELDDRALLVLRQSRLPATIGVLGLGHQIALSHLPDPLDGVVHSLATSDPATQILDLALAHDLIEAHATVGVFVIRFDRLDGV